MKRGSSRGGLRLGALLTLALAATACESTRPVTQPELPANPPGNSELRQASFIADVNTRTGKIQIKAPISGNALDGLSLSEVGLDGPNFSIIAGDVVELTASNFFASQVGEFTPGKVRVTFDILITNRLSGVRLVTPTFPVPPAGTNGILLFPFETVVTTTSGGTSVGGDGTDVIIELPNRGEVDASLDWDGNPFNFFNDNGCGSDANDCYRYETYVQPLLPTATSEARRVGFDIDPTVGNFRARLIVAANLEDGTPPAPATIQGTVSSPQRGNLAGVVVNVTPGGFSGSTSAAGAYSISGVTIGPKTISLDASTLPSGCTAPASQSVTVTSGATITRNFSVQCTVPAGTITGTITRNYDSSPLSGIQVSATPTGGSLFGPASTNAGGLYTLAGVPVGSTGSGVLTLANLPANCTNPGPLAYTGLTENGTLTQDVVLVCEAPPAGYQLTNTWSAVSGGQVTLTIAIDMSTFDNPNIPGADDVFSIAGQTTYNSAVLTAVSCANVSGSQLASISANTTGSGLIIWGNFTTTPPARGLQGITTCTFNVIGAGSVTTGTTVTEAVSENETNLIPNIVISEGTRSF
jgi:hypothetical protein